MAARIIDGLEYNTEKSKLVGHIKTSPLYWDGPQLTYAYLNVFRTSGGRYFTCNQHGEIAVEGDIKALAGRAPNLYREIYGEPQSA